MKTKFAKKLIVVFMLFITALTFCACSSVDCLTVYNVDGSIEEQVSITLNKSQIVAMGQNYNEIKLYVETISNIHAQQLVKNYILANNLQEDTEDIKPIFVRWINEDCCMVGIKFKNEDVYYNYYGITEENIAKNKTEEHYFYTKIYQTGNTKYFINESLYNDIKEEVTTDYPQFINISHSLKFTLITQDRRTHSDADSVQGVGGLYYHTWDVKEGEFDKTITIYWIIANRGHWILVCVLVSIIVCGILCGIGAYHLNKRKTKTKQ